MPPHRIINQLLPATDALPNSLYLVRKLVGVKDLNAYTWHACRNECYSWPPLPAKDWDTCKDKCPTCGEPRFQTSCKNGKPACEPFKVSNGCGEGSPA